eukprot:scaffold2351_cov403-Prasinococcus_capsulatus_cf.AAC.19
MQVRTSAGRPGRTESSRMFRNSNRAAAAALAASRAGMATGRLRMPPPWAARRTPRAAARLRKALRAWRRRTHAGRSGGGAVRAVLYDIRCASTRAAHGERDQGAPLEVVRPAPHGVVLLRPRADCVRGAWGCSDIPTKTFILDLNRKRAPSEKFVIQDLDEATLLVQREAQGFINAKLRVGSR